MYQVNHIYLKFFDTPVNKSLNQKCMRKSQDLYLTGSESRKEARALENDTRFVSIVNM